MTDTIMALSTAPGKAGIAVIRLSGENAATVAQRLFPKAITTKPRFAWYGTFYDSAGAPIDDGLCLFFPAPNSFTGEDVVEFHVHGSMAVWERFQQVLLAFAEVRLAEAGEFTRRAFMHGRLDLTKAEGLADLLAAETEAQRVQAYAQMHGQLFSVYHGWREILLNVQAVIEACIDFSEEDIADAYHIDINKKITKIQQQISRHLDDQQRGERLRHGFKVAIVGKPNVGKSSLFNAIVGRAAAIVSPIAGTTRDIIEVRLDIGGYPVILADTAGLHEATDSIEKIGIARARAYLHSADMIIHVDDTGDFSSLNNDQIPVLQVMSKVDAVADMPVEVSQVMQISVQTGYGLSQLLEAITQQIIQLAPAKDMPVITRERYRAHLQQCCEALAAYDAYQPLEINAEHVRQAIVALGKITGYIDVEDMLDRVFSTFCIGK